MFTNFFDKAPIIKNMKERYEVIKKLYPNYLILIRYKDKLKTFKEYIII